MIGLRGIPMSLHSVLMLPFQHANLAREVLEQLVELLHVFEAADDLGGVEPFAQLPLAVGAQPERKERVGFQEILRDGIGRLKVLAQVTNKFGSSNLLEKLAQVTS